MFWQHKQSRDRAPSSLGLPDQPCLPSGAQAMSVVLCTWAQNQVKLKETSLYVWITQLSLAALSNPPPQFLGLHSPAQEITLLFFRMG